MNLHRDFGNAHLVRDLLVYETVRDIFHRLLLPRRERVEARAQVRQLLLFVTLLARTSDRAGYRVQQILVAQRLGQEIDRAGLERSHGHGHIAVSGHEYDRDVDLLPDQLGLKVEAAPAGHADIEKQTARRGGKLGLQQRLSTAVSPDAQSEQQVK